MLGKQLQEEAHRLRNLYQEKVLPQQSLVVSQEAQGEGAGGEGMQGGHKEEASARPPPLTTPIYPPQAKLNVTVRVLASSAPKLQVASGDGRVGAAGGQPRAGGRRGPAGLGPHLLCPVPPEVGGWSGKNSGWVARFLRTTVVDLCVLMARLSICVLCVDLTNEWLFPD